MIRIESVSKQNGHQILFIEASASLLRGEKAREAVRLARPAFLGGALQPRPGADAGRRAPI